MLLNRAAEPYPIPPKQIESALGHPIHHTFPSDYKTVSTALNSGVPLALTGNSEHRGAVRQLHAAHPRSRRRAADGGAGQARPRSASQRLASHLVTSHESLSPLRPPTSARRPPPRRASQPPRPAVPASCAPTCTASCSNRLNLEALAQADRARAEGEIRTLLGELLAEEATPLSLAERETLFAEVLDDVFGLGPLEPLLRDPTISDILVNTYKHVFVERGGVLERVTATFQDDKHLLRVIDRIVSRVGRRVDDSSPMVDARLPTARVSTRSFRRSRSTVRCCRSAAFPAERLKADDLVTLRALTQPMLDFLVALRAGRG